MRFFKALFGKASRKQYEKEKRIIADGNMAKKRKLAANPGAHPEILFYLANDKDAETRRAVAGNAGTPVQAGDILAKDKDADVRLILAERLVKLLPELAEDMQSQLYAFAVKSLHMLARDEVVKIRIALSTSLKDHAFAPPLVVKQLAGDVERAVSEPILRHCTRLSDKDLLDVLQHHPEAWARKAVAARRDISPYLAEELVGQFDEEAGIAFLDNKSCRIEAATLSKIIEKSRDYLSWQEPVALRPELTYSFACQLAGFAREAVLDLLAKRKDFDKQTAIEISDMVRRRVAFSAGDNPHETPEQKVNRAIAEDRLDAAMIGDALSWGEERFVKLSLSRLSGIHPLIIDKIFAGQSPKSITALCWYCGLPMRLAVELQKTLGRVPAQALIYARAGVDYPLSEADMIWQLEFFGVEITTTDIEPTARHRRRY